jgi:hypothetical protein
MHTSMQTNLDQVQPGWDVIDRPGEKIGGVSDVQSDYLVLTKGLIFIKDLYVPLDAIEEVNAADETVMLNVRKADIDETRWAMAPTNGSETVRREEVILDETGDARLRGDGYVRTDRDDDDDTAGQAGGAAAGAVGGAAVGAAVGGPPGAVVGGVIGAVGGAVAGDAVEDEVEGDDPR